MTIRLSPSAFSSRNNTKKNGTLNKRKAIATFFPLHWYQQLVTDLHSTRLRNLQLNLSLNLPVNSPNLPGPNKKVINNRINQSTAVQIESIISIKNIHFKQTNKRLPFIAEPIQQPLSSMSPYFSRDSSFFILPIIAFFGQT